MLDTNAGSERLRFTGKHARNNFEPTRAPMAGLQRARALGATTVGSWRAAVKEATQLFRLAESWPERLRIARFIAELHATRLLPIGGHARDTSIRLHGSKYCFGVRTSEIYVLEEVFGYRLYDRLAHYVPGRDWIVLDVGANVGVVSMLEAKRGARVYAFEPNRDCYRRLLKNVIENRLQDRIQTFNVALGEHVGAGTMCVEGGGTTGGTVMLGDSMATDDGTRVIVTTVDQMASTLGLSRIDLLKIDVEGAEIAVLRGASRSLAMTRRMIIEYHSRPLLARAERLAAEHGFILDRKLEYAPQNVAAGQEEVGIVYFKRAAD